MEMFVNLKFTAAKNEIIYILLTTSALYLLKHNPNMQM